MGISHLTLQRVTQTRTQKPQCTTNSPNMQAFIKTCSIRFRTPPFFYVFFCLWKLVTAIYWVTTCQVKAWDTVTLNIVILRGSGITEKIIPRHVCGGLLSWGEAHGLRSQTAWKIEKELSTSDHGSLTLGYKHNGTRCLPPLPWWLPNHDGLYLQIVSQSRHFLSKVALARWSLTITRKVTCVFTKMTMASDIT